VSPTPVEQVIEQNATTVSSAAMQALNLCQQCGGQWTNNATCAGSALIQQCFINAGGDTAYFPVVSEATAMTGAIVAGDIILPYWAVQLMLICVIAIGVMACVYVYNKRNLSGVNIQRLAPEVKNYASGSKQIIGVSTGTAPTATIAEPPDQVNSQASPQPIPARAASNLAGFIGGETTRQYLERRYCERLASQGNSC
jgi:hypothetical protein